MNKSKKLYIVLSNTGSFTCKILHAFTKDNYNHSSIALDGNLSEMYSFGRKNAYFPFWGGFVKEHYSYGTFKRFFKRTQIVVIEIDVLEDTYYKISDKLRGMYEVKNKYKYDFMGIFMAYFGKTREKQYYYYCSNFVQEILSEQGIVIENQAVVKPIHFLRLPNAKILYQGRLKDYVESL